MSDSSKRPDNRNTKNSRNSRKSRKKSPLTYSPSLYQIHTQNSRPPKSPTMQIKREEMSKRFFFTQKEHIQSRYQQAKTNSNMLLNLSNVIIRERSLHKKKNISPSTGNGAISNYIFSPR
jgi:hypothetical protein